MLRRNGRAKTRGVFLHKIPVGSSYLKNTVNGLFGTARDQLLLQTYTSP